MAAPGHNARVTAPPVSHPLSDATPQPGSAHGSPNPQWSAFFQGISNRSATTPAWITDTHANRANYDPQNYVSNPVQSSAGQYQPNSEGALYYESDRTVFYRSVMVSNVATWVYFSGTFTCTQATLPTLGTADAGFLAYVSDYNHVLQWSGSAWNWAPGENGSGMLQLFEVDPTGTGWHLYDGSTVNYLKATGALGSITLPDLTSLTTKAAFTVAGSPDSGVNAAVAPTISGSGGNTGSNTTSITLPTNTGNDSASQAVASGAGTTVAAHPHTHTEGSITDPGHTHSLGTITASTNGQPQNIIRRPFFRQ